MLRKIEQSASVFCYSACFFVISLLSLSIILTLLNQFIFLYVVLSTILAFLLSGVFFFLIKKDSYLFPRLNILAIGIITGVLLIFVFFPHDTFGGRDESLFSNLAVHLAESGSLNFPPYLSNETEGIRARLPAYTVWLAIQKLFFGDEWLLRSNVILTGLGLSALYLTGTILGGKITGLLTIILYVSSMPFLWFSRETMTENLAFFLLWSLILFILTVLKTKKLLYLSAAFIAGWLFSLTRVEGFFIQISTLLAIVVVFTLEKLVSYKKLISILIVGCLLILTSFFVIKLFSFDSYFHESVTDAQANLLNSFSNQLNSNQNQIKEDIKFNERLPSFFLAMLGKYNFILIFFAIFFVVVNALFKKKHHVDKVYLLTILLIIAPEFIKLFNPGVTIDQPWLYRRYVYALLPFGYICFIFLLNLFKNKKLLVILSIVLFIINITLSNQLLFVKNNWLLINKLKEISKDISKKDFVIIESWTLEYYYPGSFLILQKGVRSAFASTINPKYFFPEKKLFNNVPYEKIFLLTTKEKSVYPLINQAIKNPISFIDVEYAQVIPSCQLNFLGLEEGLANPYAFDKLSLSSVLKYCSLPVNEIKNHKEKLYLYELIYNKEVDHLKD